MTEQCKREWEVRIGGYHGEDVIAECGCGGYTSTVCKTKPLDRWEIRRRINEFEKLEETNEMLREAVCHSKAYGHIKRYCEQKGWDFTDLFAIEQRK